jgi:hypothetical protein
LRNSTPTALPTPLALATPPFPIPTNSTTPQTNQTKPQTKTHQPNKQIVGLLLLNAAISFVEEASADKAIQALAGALAPKARALRDGSPTTVDARDVVPGMRVYIYMGGGFWGGCC